MWGSFLCQYSHDKLVAIQYNTIACNIMHVFALLHCDAFNDAFTDFLPGLIKVINL